MRITTPRPKSNSNFLPSTSTKMAEPNRSAFGKGVPVPSSVTRISSERAAAETVSIVHSENMRAIKRNPLFRTYLIDGLFMLSEAKPLAIGGTGFRNQSEILLPRLRDQNDVMRRFVYS